VFAHGSTDLTHEEARHIIADLRSETAFAGSELKSSRLLDQVGRRARCRAVL
jgi:hypothetical protein